MFTIALKPLNCTSTYFLANCCMRLSAAIFSKPKNLVKYQNYASIADITKLPPFSLFLSVQLYMWPGYSIRGHSVPSSPQGGHQELEIGVACVGGKCLNRDIWRHFGDIWRHFGDILGTFWGHFGDILLAGWASYELLYMTRWSN